LSVVPATTTTPTSSLHELHRINLIRSNLGRIGDEAIRGPFEGGSTAPLTKVNLTRDTTDVSFPLGAQTRRIDIAGRIKLHLTTGTVSSQLNWKAGTLNVVISDGWASLSQTPDLVGAPRGRCSTRAGFTVTADAERICLRPAHMTALGVGPGDHILVVAVPETGTVLMVHPDVCAPFVPGHLADFTTRDDTP
jgi:hypothetical protein